MAKRKEKATEKVFSSGERLTNTIIYGDYIKHDNKLKYYFGLTEKECK